MPMPPASDSNGAFDRKLVLELFVNCVLDLAGIPGRSSSVGNVGRVVFVLIVLVLGIPFIAVVFVLTVSERWRE